MSTGLATGDTKISSQTTSGSPSDSISTAANGKESEGSLTVKIESPVVVSDDDRAAPGIQSSQKLPSHLYSETSGCPFGVYSRASVNPSSPSFNDQNPAANYGTTAGSVISQPGVFAAAQSSPFAVPNSATLSPPRSSKAMMMGIPPASPLFPRASSAGLDNGLPYISSALGSAASPMPYQAAYAESAARIETQGSSDEGSWDRGQNAYPSPQLGAQGMMYAMPRGTRAYSFDGETVFLPTMLDDQSYSTYNASLSPTGGTMFAAHQSWSYPGPPPDIYSTPASPLQPRPTVHDMYPIGGSMQPMGSYGLPQFFPATSPGPAIQTTASNKGPDGANLFIFHIPNNFTNIDMYNLFCRYGNLLSVRVMVERDTGRSRGFGFVSYDNPGSAALAIQELNGYAIGNKRLKVQHKQIRSKDIGDREYVEGGSYDHGSDEGNYATAAGSFSSLPPPGPMSQDLWFDPDSEEVPTMTGVDYLASQSDVRHSGHGRAEVESNVEPGQNDEPSPLTDMGALQSALPGASGEADK